MFDSLSRVRTIVVKCQFRRAIANATAAFKLAIYVQAVVVAVLDSMLTKLHACKRGRAPYAIIASAPSQPPTAEPSTPLSATHRPHRTSGLKLSSSSTKVPPAIQSTTTLLVRPLSAILLQPPTPNTPHSPQCRPNPGNPPPKLPRQRTPAPPRERALPRTAAPHKTSYRAYGTTT